MKAKIIEILTDIRSEFDFNEDINFFENGMLDSFDIVTLVTALDEEYKISIDGTDIIPDNFSTVNSIEKLLSKYGVK
jgi:D-alanine--poly(phosphoribitol) ligase subunit 2